MTPLKDHYEKVFHALRLHAPELPELLERLSWNPESKEDVVCLVQNLPEPDHASDPDILCIFEELRRGNLEWAYRLPYCGNLLGVHVRELLSQHREDIKTLSPEFLQKRSYWLYTQQSKEFPASASATGRTS